MDFRAAFKVLAEGSLSSDMSMDTTNMADGSPDGRPTPPALPPSTDGMDPATPGGPAPYNGSEPFGDPVTSDPLWKDPQDRSDHRRQPVPHVEGPDEDKTTLRNP
jgi:hypothetical protein